MPVAQWHYPFENQELWAEQQQADFICEAIDQTRGWFYTLHAVSTLLFDRPAFKNVICLGHILAEDGSQDEQVQGQCGQPVGGLRRARRGRHPLVPCTPPALPATAAASAPTWWAKSCAVHEYVVEYVQFFCNVCESQRVGMVRGERAQSQLATAYLLDRWLLSELNRLVRDVTEAYETYDVMGATRPVADFVDSLSNWYVRQSRRRFWDGDAQALNTLHHVLVTVSQLLAPTMPFMAEEMYQNLAASALPGAPGFSVHLSRWPEVDAALIDEQLSADMALVQKVTSLGHAARQLASLKVRQPLAQVVVRTRKPGEKDGLLRHQRPAPGRAECQSPGLRRRRGRSGGCAGPSPAQAVGPEVWVRASPRSARPWPRWIRPTWPPASSSARPCRWRSTA